MNEGSADHGNTAGRDDAQDTDRLFAAVYERLKAMAGRRFAEGRDATLDTTALVHEVYLRMGDDERLRFRHENEFFGYAARALRHLLIDRARRRAAQKAGGDWQRVTLTGRDQELAIDSAMQALALDESLDRLAHEDARAAKLVELIYFAGLTLEKAAEALAISTRTANRDWSFARAFLAADLGQP